MRKVTVFLVVFVFVWLCGCGPEHQKSIAKAKLVEDGCPKILEQTLKVSDECSRTEYQEPCREVVRYHMGWPYRTCEHTGTDCFRARGGDRLLELSQRYGCICEGCRG